MNPEDLSDIPFFYHWMKEENINWWKNFINNQMHFYPKDCWNLDNENSFWPQRHSSDSVTESIIHRPLQVHGGNIQTSDQPLTSAQQFNIDDVVVIDDPYEAEEHNFRVAKICSISPLMAKFYILHPKKKVYEFDNDVEYEISLRDILGKGKMNKKWNIKQKLI